ncbi:MAG: hypothetical protein OXF05_03440, partial [Hyphomicrobiales bacterium]|nr:hypothetical protein [Hyphomicrobiales bacterium]
FFAASPDTYEIRSIFSAIFRQFLEVEKTAEKGGIFRIMPDFDGKAAWFPIRRFANLPVQPRLFAAETG